MDTADKELGVAISGGGHRAALWGLSSLLYLLDSGLNRKVSVISSVSGGSITNGVVAKRTDFQDTATNPGSFRTGMQPLVSHVTTDGLFFYGSSVHKGIESFATIDSDDLRLANPAVVVPPGRKEPARV